MHEGKDGRRGSALVPALLAIMLTAGLCVSYMSLSLSKNHESQVAVDSKRAFYVAESGLAEAYYGLARGLDGSVGSEAQPARFGTGVYWVTCEDLGDRVVLHSTGLSGLGRAAVSATLRKAGASVASLGLYANRRIELSSGALVDAYDSTQGPYRSSSLGPRVPARVGCNSGIDLAGRRGLIAGARIDGDATPGPASTVVRGTGATVTGSTAPAPETTLLPALQIVVPDSAVPLTQRSGSALRLSAGAYSWSSLHLERNSVVRIDGPATVVLDQLVLDSGARLELDGSAGAVDLSVRSYLGLALGSTFTTLSQQPDRVSLQIAASQTLDRNGDRIPDPPVMLAASGSFYGTIYAPAAQLVLPPNFSVYGSAVADSIVLGPGTRLHLDQALQNSLAQGSLPEFVCWRVEELPDAQLVKLGYDPLTVLKLNNIVPVQPADAHVVEGAVRLDAVGTLLAPVTRLP